MSKKIIRINASALKQSACFLHFYRTVIQGYKEKLQFNDVEFGSAVHLFLKVMYQTNGNFAEAIRAAREYFETTKMAIRPKKGYLNNVHLMGVCIKYWQWLQENDNAEVLLKDDNTPAVELTFSNLYYEDNDYQVYFEGTIDKVVKFKNNGCYAIGDYKTTSSWDSQQFLRSFELSPQLKFYFFNLHLFAKSNPDSFIAKMCKLPIGCFIDGIFLNGKDTTEFERSRIYFFKQKDMDEFESMLHDIVARLLLECNANTVPLPEGKINGACTQIWGPCKFFEVEAAPDEVAAGHYLRNNFIQEEYNPLKRADDI